MRLPPIARSDLPEGVGTLLDLATPPGGATPPTIAVLAHQPGLLEPFLTWAAALALQGVLPRRDHEILAMRTARNYRSSFEWDEHVRFARDATLSGEEIEWVRSDSDAASWRPHESALLAAADQLHAHHTIDDGTWGDLAAHFPAPAMVEIPFVVGQYAMLSMVANAIGA
jgi:4-carboxymuconolactone decarboxylase